jgi:hypothetical protein
MRPTARTQSAFRHPLNNILATEANVRILREIYLSDVPIGVSELARRAKLQKSGVARSCVPLEDLGVIETVGRGSYNRQYRRAASFALANPLASLFMLERGHAETVLAEIRQMVQSAGIRAAWIEGSVAAANDTPEDSIEVVVLADSAQIEQVRSAIWSRLIDVERLRDVAIRLTVKSLADLKTSTKAELERLSDVQILSGPSPVDLLHAGAPDVNSSVPSRTRSHAVRDEQALALARVIAKRIRRDPSIVEDARRFIARRLAAASPGEQLELREWDALLTTKSPARLSRFLTEKSERATRLRQSLPFLDALTPEERLAVVHEADTST